MKTDTETVNRRRALNRALTLLKSAGDLAQTWRPGMLYTRIDAPGLPARAGDDFEFQGPADLESWGPVWTDPATQGGLIDILESCDGIEAVWLVFEQGVGDARPEWVVHVKLRSGRRISQAGSGWDRGEALANAIILRGSLRT